MLSIMLSLLLFIPPLKLLLQPSTELFTTLLNTMLLMEIPMDMMRAMVMSNLIHSTLSMKFMMIITTLTSESPEKETAMVTSRENMKLLFLMAESNMSTMMLMVNMVVLSWMLSTRERLDTLNPMEDILEATLEVIMLNMEQFKPHLIMNKKKKFMIG